MNRLCPLLSRRFPLAALLLALVFGLIPCAVQAQIPPEARWQTIESANFRVTFAPGLEELARHAARRAEAAHLRLTAELAAAPAGKIDILLTDYVDISNGSATPIPSNRIILYARPPVDMLSLAYFDDWLDLVVTHELAHIFHLDGTGRLGRGLRAIFGRVPATWPIFPAVGTPTWSIEGLATYIESRFTGAGRVRGSYHEMVLRTAILEDAFASIDQVSGTSALWPGGSRSYIYGSLFLEYLSNRYGPKVQKDLVEATVAAWIPAPLAFDRIARKTTDNSFSQLFGEWRADLELRYQALADSLRATGLTHSERLGVGGYNTQHPRVAPDGRVAFAAADGRHTTANKILDPATGRIETLSRRNDVGPSAWFPDGALLTAQIEFDGPYRIYSDLYRVDAQGEHRLTHGARLTEPDLAPDGHRVVAVQSAGGTNRLVIHDLETGVLHPLTAADPAVHWAFPRWAPDGARIAVSRWEAGLYDVVVLDTLGALRHRVTADRALDSGPAWSADGRYLIFSSDRGGIPNLYAYDLRPAAVVATRIAETQASTTAAPRAPQLYQVTNLLTGAFFPDPSPDGQWIYFSGYHADGFHIERIHFDPAAWRMVETSIPELAVDWERATDLEKAATTTLDQPSALPEAGPARPYTPGHSLLPRYWLPFAEGGTATGTFFGALTSGADLVGRHTYSLNAAYQPTDRLYQGAIAYRYAGLGQPVLGLTAERSWEGALLDPAGAPGTRILFRDDEARLSASLRRQRRRSTAEFTIAAEGVRRERILRDAVGVGLIDPSDLLLGAIAQMSFANYRSQPFSISPEDGVALSLTGRRRWDLDPYQHTDGRIFNAGYDEVSGQFRGYKALGLPGFANHILALRASARWRQGPGAYAFGVGGGSGSALDLGVQTIGGEYRFLPVRGFRENDRYGTRAWSTSLEYRFPLAQINRGIGLWPIFLDRLSGSLFVDAGNAGCSVADRVRLGNCSAEAAGALISSGAEVGLDAAFFGAATRLRGGVAVPLQGRDGRPQLYLQLGLPF